MEIDFRNSSFSEVFEELYCEFSNPNNEAFKTFRLFANIKKQTLCKTCQKNVTIVKYKHTPNNTFLLESFVILDSSEGESSEISLEKKQIAKLPGRYVFTRFVVNGERLENSTIKLRRKNKIKIEGLGFLSIRQPRPMHKHIRSLSRTNKKFLSRVLTSNLNGVDLGATPGKSSSTYLCREIIRFDSNEQIIEIADSTLILACIAYDDNFFYSPELAIRARYDFVSGVSSKLILTPLDLNHAYIKNSTTDLEIQGGYVFSGRNGGNYFHALIEDLTTFVSVEKDLIDSCSILISKDTPKAITEVLNILYPKRRFEYVEPQKTYYARKLYLGNRLFEHHDTVFKPWSLGSRLPKKELVNLVNKLTLMSDVSSVKQQPKYIYIERKLSLSNTNARSTRLTLLARIKLINQGFQFIDPSTMSLTDQIRVFASAEIILAPSGAALANLIFSNSKAKIFVFVPKSLDDFDIWIKLGAISGATVKNISVESLWQGKRFGPYHQMHSPMIVSLGDLRKCDFNIAKKTIELKYVKLFEFLKQFSISKNPYKYLSLIPRSRVFRYTSISLGLIIIRFFSMILKK